MHYTFCKSLDLFEAILSGYLYILSSNETQHQITFDFKGCVSFGTDYARHNLQQQFE